MAPLTPPYAGGYESTPLHDERLDTVTGVLLASGAASILDLGCGTGELLSRLLRHDQFTRIVGVDTSAEALSHARRLVQSARAGEQNRLALVQGSFTEPSVELGGFHAATLVETIEHIAPGDLSRLERAVFAGWRPGLVVVTTPNREYNVLYGLSEGEYRHPEHLFEWDRSRFRSWASGVARRNGYGVECDGIGPSDPLLGSPTHLGVFRRPRPDASSDDESVIP